MKYLCWIKGRLCEYSNARGWCEISACIKEGKQYEYRRHYKNIKHCSRTGKGRSM